MEFQDLATIECPTGCKISLLCLLVRLSCMFTHVHALPVKEVKRLKIAREYFIFGVGFALSVLNSKAMRRPLRVELTKVQSRFFCMPLKLRNN